MDLENRGKAVKFLKKAFVLSSIDKCFMAWHNTVMQIARIV